jgi:hypothetical protein
MEEDRLIREMRKVFKTHHDLLEHVGADNVGNAKKKIDRERAEFERTKEQLQEVVNALDADNWRNAVVRAKSLLNKLEREALPVWLRSISPYWVGRIAPSSYKHWHTFCREQFLVALSALQHDVELGLEVDVEEQIEAMRKCYLGKLPGEFVEDVSAYVTQDYEEYGFEEQLTAEQFSEWQRENKEARDKHKKEQN